MTTTIQLYHCPMQKLGTPGRYSIWLGRSRPDRYPLRTGLPSTTSRPGGHSPRPFSKTAVFSVLTVAWPSWIRSFGLLAEKLIYRAIGFSSWSGDGPVLQHLRCVTQATPVVIFSKGTWRIKSSWYNHYRCDHPEQDLHPWQKVLDDMAHWVESFTEPGDLVCDPLAGSFTAASPARSWLGRSSAATKIRGMFLIGQRRLREFRAAGQIGRAGMVAMTRAKWTICWIRRQTRLADSMATALTTMQDLPNLGETPHPGDHSAASQREDLAAWQLRQTSVVAGCGCSVTTERGEIPRNLANLWRDR